jgi:CPA1 family monovalent cation:H+ antiporter
MTRVLPLRFLYERFHAIRTAREYEQIWGRHQASVCVMKSLEEIMKHTPARADVVREVYNTYERWNESARDQIDAIAEQFSEFVSSMQQRLAERMLIHAEREAIEEKERNGTISHGVAKAILEKLTDEVYKLRGRESGKLRVDPSELLNKVHFFKDIPREDFPRIVERLRSRTVPAGKAIIRQGETGDSLYLIARGVVRISRVDIDVEQDLATMIAGDFFGEIALLGHCVRTATYRAVTPCAIYELTRKGFETVAAAYPGIYDAVYKTGHERAVELDGKNKGEI